MNDSRNFPYLQLVWHPPSQNLVPVTFREIQHIQCTKSTVLLNLGFAALDYLCCLKSYQKSKPLDKIAYMNVEKYNNMSTPHSA